jgi:anti-sigma B factor antagonist
MEFYYHGVDGDVLILAADGGLNAETANRFVDDLDRVIHAGVRRVIVDCTQLRYVSSYGLGVLVRLHKRLSERGGDVRLAAVQPRIARFLEMVRLAQIFDIYPTVDAARESFGKRHDV